MALSFAWEQLQSALLCPGAGSFPHTFFSCFFFFFSLIFFKVPCGRSRAASLPQLSQLCSLQTPATFLCAPGASAPLLNFPPLPCGHLGSPSRLSSSAACPYSRGITVVPITAGSRGTVPLLTRIPQHQWHLSSFPPSSPEHSACKAREGNIGEGKGVWKKGGKDGDKKKGGGEKEERRILT